jgi:FdhD protein
MTEDRAQETEENALPPPAVSLPCIARRGALSSAQTRCVPDEIAIAFTVHGSTHAVMMASPIDLEDFGVGFALSEGLVEDASEIESLDVVTMPLGIEVRLWLRQDRGKVYGDRRRTLAGPTGCGLCGIESLEAAMRPAPRLLSNDVCFEPQAIVAAMACLAQGQELHEQTHAVHAAGFWTPTAGLIAVREDVGRHNALDKLGGALARSGQRAADGVVVMTSRVSIELIQKTARFGAPVLAAISAPTAAAVRLAEACNMTLVAVARGQDFEMFTHPERLKAEASRHVA